MINNEILIKRITTSSSVLSGKPVIKGTRLSVQFILGLLASGESIETILDEYKGLEKDDILACLQFATQTVADSTFIPLDAPVHAQ